MPRRPGTTPRGGAPTKRTPEVESRLLGLLRAAVPKEAAARSVGLAPSTFFKWQQEDAEFSEAVEKAVAESEAVLIARVAKASQEPKHWTAAMTLLERRFPERWRRRDAIEVDGRLELDVTLARLREIAKEALRESPGDDR